MPRPKYLTKPRRYQLSNLWDRHYEILRLVAAGMSYSDVAARLNITTQTVGNTVNSPLGRIKIAKMREGRDVAVGEIRARIIKLLPRAVAVLASDLEDGLPEIRNRTARDLLDRAGVNESKKGGLESMAQTLSKNDILELKGIALRVIKGGGNGGT